jgi:hypothetical protein
LKFFARVGMSASRMTQSFIYGLTNLEFEGPEVTTLPNGSWRRDRLTFPYKNLICCLQQAADYKQIIDLLGKEHGAAITAHLTITGDHCLPIVAVDELADAVCELLAFVTKNTVFWVEREIDSPSKGEPSHLRRSLGGRARNFHSGWSIINDVVITETGHRAELQMFLSAVFERYFDILRSKLKTPLIWINESEHHSFVDLRFISLFIGIERLRIEFLPKPAINNIHADWQRLLDGQLALDILGLIEGRTGTLTEDQKRSLISKLRSADTPSAAELLDELCRALGVTGLERDMGILRNKLTHTASYGSFDFSKVIDLQYKLSHVVDLCVLKILEYGGFYCHKNTGWRNIRLSPAKSGPVSDRPALDSAVS